MNFLELRQNARKDTSQFSHKSKLAILADSSTQFFTIAIKGVSYLKKIALEIFEAGYDQIELQINDNTSELYSFLPNFILLDMCAEKLYEKFIQSECRNIFAETTAQIIFSYWDKLTDSILSSPEVIQFLFIERNDFVLGNFATKNENSFFFQIKKLNFLLMQESYKRKNISLIDINYYQNLFSEKIFFDKKLYCTSKITISLEVLPVIAESVLKIIMVHLGIIKKCIIFDLDNTIWGGVIGDDGISGIQIGDLGIGRAFSDLQVWLKELGRRGIILCVCSKNNEDIAKEVFEKHPDMVIRLSDISMFVANWNNKADNIKQIQKTLNIGMDSIVFIDDNIFERNLVRSIIPEITVPELPEDPAMYLSFLQELNLFETVSLSSDDIIRKEQYKAEAQRVETRNRFLVFEDYLESLEMKSSICEFDKFSVPRISQLSQRSNQFNLRTVRYTEQMILKIMDNEDYVSRYFTLTDKFGDSGIVSVIIMNKNLDTLFIENWFMSCRVLKRGMEEFIMNSIVQLATECKIKKIVGEYIPTKKNGMVKDIYEKLGFSKTSENTFELDVCLYKKIKTFIKER